MARPPYPHGPQVRARAARPAHAPVELLILLLFLAMAALWITGLGDPALLPIAQPR